MFSNISHFDLLKKMNIICYRLIIFYWVWLEATHEGVF